MGATGNQAGSNSGNFSGIGSPPGTVGAIPATTVPTSNMQGQSLGDLHGGWDVAGQTAGNQGAGYGGATATIGTPNVSDIGIVKGISKGLSFLGQVAQVFGLPSIAGVAAGSAPILGLLSGAVAMANSARGHGQPPGEVGPAMAAGAGPGGMGGPGEAMTLPSLTGITNPILPGQEQPSAAEPRSISVPVGDITSSFFSVPPRKVNLSNLMAARGIRGAGTKTALPEGFRKGKRGS